MLLSDFNYTLPEALIAQTPSINRGESRMLVIDRTAGCWKDLHFQDLPQHLKSGDRLIFNNTRVIPARLFGTKTSASTDTSQDQLHGRIEILLLKQVKQSPVCWEALVRPSRRIRKGERFVLPEGIEAVILEESSDSSRIIQFSSNATNFTAWLERVSHIPLPPYIKRSDTLVDRSRYQTVFAVHLGSVAAPTAGLHFTSDTLTEIDSIDVRRVEVTLHVGLGTFQPIRTEIIENHLMHTESYQISSAAAKQLRGPGRRLAVGTTTVRTLEHAIKTSLSGEIEASHGDTDLFIRPGFKFRATDGLLTNFHLPQSTLLMLVCAFAGQELTLAAYRHAVNQKYRFYSYGDCMLII